MGPRSVDLVFVCAMPMEMEPIARRLGMEEEPIGGIRLWLGETAGRPLAGVVTGMGPSSAGGGVAGLLTAVTPARLAVVGVTGAVHQDAPIGEVVDVSVVVDGATGRRHQPYRIGEPLPPRPPPVTGALWTAAEVITDPADIARLGDEGVVALDMETAVIAGLCAERGVPWGVYRAVSDLATDGRVGEYVAHVANPDGSPNRAAQERYLALNPDRAPAISGLIEDVLLACETAASAAIRSTLG